MPKEQKPRRKPYKLCAFYDSETTNISAFGDVAAFPVVHQLGVLTASDLRNVTPDNVVRNVEIGIYRHTFEVCEAIEALPDRFPWFVPVVAIHNLGFDMWGLSAWLSGKSCRVLAKSAAKPITITVLDENDKPSLVLWDTLGLSMQGLARMGEDCGFAKGVGEWDYTLTRTPATKLTREELDYAKRDIYTLACWFGWFLRRNPQIEDGKLGFNIVTKTGVVRNKRIKLFDQIKGKGCGQNVGRYWHYLNKRELCKSDEELFTMNACTRGGKVFCASRWASVPIVCDDDHVVAGFDATSQHPGQMASHLYPVRFAQASPGLIDKYAKLVSLRTLDSLLDKWHCPFNFAFNALFELDNIRLKEGSIFEREGIGCLAWARFGTYQPPVDTDNESADIFNAYIYEKQFKDTAEGATHSFGKLTSARKVRVFLTELEYWNVCQEYDFDASRCVFGYASSNFEKPTDLSLLSVMHFYKAKDVFKQALHEYEKTGRVRDTRELRKYTPDSIAEGMERGTLSMRDAKAAYQVIKSDLNALFGIEATNESRLDAEITARGIVYVGTPGIENLPKNPKSWYQYGQRIVGWSRIAQVVVMMLAAPYVEGIPNGDTDSCKFYMRKDRMPVLERELSKLSRAIDKARKRVCYRVERQYPEFYYDLEGIGHYVLEFEVDRFCAAWNKAYAIRDGKGYHFTLAGIPSDKRSPGKHDSYDDFALELERGGLDFGQVCDLCLGYNVHLSPSIVKTNGRKSPEWGEMFYREVADYKGDASTVAECASMALYAMPKVIGGTESPENAANYALARQNRPTVNGDHVLLEWHEGRANVVRLLERDIADG